MFFWLSNSEKEYIRDGVAQDMRMDGRKRMEQRAITIESDVLDTANGSCFLQVDNTRILVGVKVEISEPHPETPDMGNVVCSVECCPSASPEFEGRGAEELNIELARMMERIFSSSIDRKALCILPAQQCWTIFIDVVVLASSGNLFDCISIASRTALQNAKIPKISVVANDADGGYEIELSDDPLDCTSISVENLPIFVTLTKIGKNYVVDASIEEELCQNVRFTVAVDKSGNFCTILKGGKGALDHTLMLHMLQSARTIGTKTITKLDGIIARREKHLTEATKSMFI